MFVKIEGDSVLLSQSGVYKVSDLYRLDDALFAKLGGGFVRLYATGATSKPNVNISRLVTNMPLFKDQFGRLSARSGTALSETASALLRVGA